MPSDPKNDVKLQTTDQIHQQTAANIQNQLKAVYGEDHEVVPTNEETDVSETISEDLDRLIFNKPGYEPSKKFLSKVIDRVKKKNPNSQVKLKD